MNALVPASSKGQWGRRYRMPILPFRHTTWPARCPGGCNQGRLPTRRRVLHRTQMPSLSPPLAQRASKDMDMDMGLGHGQWTCVAPHVHPPWRPGTRHCVSWACSVKSSSRPFRSTVCAVVSVQLVASVCTRSLQRPFIHRPRLSDQLAYLAHRPAHQPQPRTCRFRGTDATIIATFHPPARLHRPNPAPTTHTAPAL